MSCSIVRADVPSSVDSSDDMVSRERVGCRAMTTADPAALLLGQHLLAHAAMVGTETTLI
jgi:hypothetical protein